MPHAVSGAVVKVYRRFFLGGQKWTAYIVGPKSKHLVHEGEHKGGTCSYYDGKIYISSDQSAEQREDYFLHEVLHALIWLCGRGKFFAEDKLEEDFVVAMTPHLHRFLKDLGFEFPKVPS
jgi:hypothetical protein